MKKSDNSICVRLASTADVASLAELLCVLFEQEADFAPNITRQTKALQMIIAHPEIGQIYCATERREIVGMVSLLFTVSTAEGGRAAWLEDMVVHPKKRRRGIGKRLLEEAMSGAEAAGCSRITLLTDADNEAGMVFYEQLGFSRSKMVPYRMHL
jgi:GNAT superfamily N-acetyltransferase